MPSSTMLEAFSGEFNEEAAAHLLRRTLFGPDLAQISQCVDQGLDWTLDELFKTRPLPNPPLNYDDENDPYTPIGKTWVEQPVAANRNRFPRRKSIFGWTISLMLKSEISIREKMVLFWHNHFVIGDVNDAKYLYEYSQMLRKHALGNFRDLTKAVTISPAMLRYLNGNQNKATAPNENYARELLELFTIGKGPITGSGDYTNYTEEDVAEMARVLTGWIDRKHHSKDVGKVYSEFINSRHDKLVKKLSHRFDNTLISNGDDSEYAHLIDIIFKKSEVANFMVRKLYRWFIYHDITDEVESDFITPLAKQLFEEDFELAPVLRRLLSSTHFFAQQFKGAMVKNPADYVLTAIRQFSVFQADTLAKDYHTWYRLWQKIRDLGMEYYNPPQVAGWKAYFQAPLFYQTWINSTSLPIRMKYTTDLTERGFPLGGQKYLNIDVWLLLDQIKEPLDPNLLIREIGMLIFPQPISEKQATKLKDVLIPGLPDYEWSIELGDYLAAPSADLEKSIRNKLLMLLKSMMSMPEYFLA